MKIKAMPAEKLHAELRRIAQRVVAEEQAFTGLAPCKRRIDAISAPYLKLITDTINLGTGTKADIVLAESAFFTEIDEAIREYPAVLPYPPKRPGGPPSVERNGPPSLIDKLKDQAEIIGEALGRETFVSTAGAATEADFQDRENEFDGLFTTGEIIFSGGKSSDVEVLRLIFTSAIRAAYARRTREETR